MCSPSRLGKTSGNKWGGNEHADVAERCGQMSAKLSVMCHVFPESVRTAFGEHVGEHENEEEEE